MTAAMKIRPGHHARKAGAITPLLRFLAGAYAEDIARIWPAPHEGFLALPAARRHTAAVLIRTPLGDAGSELDLRRAIERGKDSRIASLIMAKQDMPGLMKAFGKMGEVLWSEKEYWSFLELFGAPNAARVLRHLEALSPQGLAPLAALPECLREASIVEAVGNLPAATDLAAALGLAVRIRGEHARRKIAQRWVRAEDRRRLFDMAIEDLNPDLFRLVEPAPVLGPPFERIENRKQLNAVAHEFANCLRDFTNDIAIGRMVVYVWRGNPNAVVALNWDAAGWRLAEAESKGNSGLDDAVIREIAGAVEQAGGRLGPAVGTLAKRLHQRGYGDANADPPGTTWVDRLELGDLWE